MNTGFLHTRSFLLAVIVLVFFSIVCTQIPLFNYLGFEFSVLTVLFAGWCIGLVSLALWKNSNCSIKSDVWKFIGKVTVAQFVLIAIPFVISLANIVFVKNCSPGEGMVLYALVVIPGAFFSLSLSMCVALIVPGWKKTSFILLYLLVLSHIPLVTFFRPQIFAFNPIIGFFPGVTYDETLQITQRLILYRTTTLALSFCILATSIWIWQSQSYKKGLIVLERYSAPLLEAVLLAFTVPFILVMFISSDKYGLSSSEQFIRQKLVGSYSTPHFEIIYPAGSLKHEKVEQLGRLHEYYYSKLSHSLNVQIQEPVLSFIYSSPEEKLKLIGAGQTDISKPWLRQMHINLSDIEAGLKHELVHVFASEFGWSPFKISRNSGIVEGLAVALGDDVWYNEPLDRAAALVFASGATPEVESLFSLSGFAKFHGGTSYTLAGSFCKFLIDSFGVETFKKLYRSGDFDLEYHQPITSLITEWKTKISQQSLTSNDSVKAKYFFRRSSIFEKVCARVIANKNAETRKMLAHHDFEQALVSSEQSLALQKTPEAVMQKSRALFELRKFSEAINFIETQFRDSTLRPLLLPLHLRLGDAYWAIDSIAKAKEEYSILQNVHLDPWSDEACALRLVTMQAEQERHELMILFVYSMEDTARIQRLSKLTSPIARYMLASERVAASQYREACILFEQAETLGSGSIRFFYFQRLGKVYFSMQEWQKAERAFEQAMDVAPTPSAYIEQKNWIDRCKYEMQ